MRLGQSGEKGEREREWRERENEACTVLVEEELGPSG